MGIPKRLFKVTIAVKLFPAIEAQWILAAHMNSLEAMKEPCQVLVRAAFALGGLGSGFASNEVRKPLLKWDDWFFIWWLIGFPKGGWIAESILPEN